MAKTRGRIRYAFVLGLFVWVSFLQLPGHSVSAVQFTSRQLNISDSRVGETNVTYQLSFSGQSAGNVGAVRLQFCENDPFPGYPCTPAPGLNVSSAALTAQSGMTGFSISNATTANELVLTRTPAPAGSAAASYTFTGITNPTNTGTTYVRLETFYTADTSQPKDAGGLAIGILPGVVSIRTYVPPYLTFCIGQTIQGYDCATAEGNYVDFGVLSSTMTKTAQTKALIATNADFGYTIRMQGTSLLSGVNEIPPLATPDVSRPGTSQFGINLRSNSSPPSGQDPAGLGVGVPGTGYNTPNQYKFVSGEVIASNTAPDDYRMYTVNYIVNVAKSQPPGIYVTTLTYIALASF